MELNEQQLTMGIEIYGLAVISLVMQPEAAYSILAFWISDKAKLALDSPVFADPKFRYPFLMHRYHSLAHSCCVGWTWLDRWWWLKREKWLKILLMASNNKQIQKTNHITKSELIIDNYWEVTSFYLITMFCLEVQVFLWVYIIFCIYRSWPDPHILACFHCSSGGKTWEELGRISYTSWHVLPCILAKDQGAICCG